MSGTSVGDKVEEMSELARIAEGVDDPPILSSRNGGHLGSEFVKRNKKKYVYLLVHIYLSVCVCVSVSMYHH